MNGSPDDADDPWVDDDPWLDDGLSPVDGPSPVDGVLPDDAAPQPSPPTGLPRPVVRLLQLVGLVVLGLAGSAIAAFIATRDDGGVAPSATEEASTEADLRRVGPAVGDQVATYIQRRSLSLEAATGPQVGVVSFGAYVGVDEARDLLSGVEITTFLVAAPGFAAEQADDVNEWVDTLLEKADAERLAFEELIPTTDQEEFRADYQAQAQRLGQLVSALRDASEAGDAPAVVFGAVVAGGIDALAAVGTASEVRLVDAQPALRVSAGAVFRGLLPEETVQVGAPAVREAPLR